MLIGPWGVLLADRIDKHRLVLATQVAAATLALTLGVLTLTGVVTLWMVAVPALGLGIVSSLDNPACQSFVVETVGDTDLPNAVTLNSITVNAARAVGPAVAGFLIATVGLGWSFVLNAATYSVVVVALLRMDLAALHRILPPHVVPVSSVTGSHMPGGPRSCATRSLRWRWRTPAYEFAVTLPLLARLDIGGDTATLGLLNTAFGAGAVLGGLVRTATDHPTRRQLMSGGVAFSIALLATAMAPSLTVALATLASAGATPGRPRVPRGSRHVAARDRLPGHHPHRRPIVGTIGERLGARWAMGTGALATPATITGVAVSHRLGTARAAAREPGVAHITSERGA